MSIYHFLDFYSKMVTQRKVTMLPLFVLSFWVRSEAITFEVYIRCHFSAILCQLRVFSGIKMAKLTLNNCMYIYCNVYDTAVCKVHF